MKAYPNYRVSVELVFKNKDHVLLTKRSGDSETAPGVWNVPAGKVKYDEVPIQAVHREALEETKLRLSYIKEIGIRNQSWRTKGEDVYRLIITYLVLPEDYSGLALNDEHTEFAWVNKDMIRSEQYNSLYPALKDNILMNVFQEEGLDANG